MKRSDLKTRPRLAALLFLACTGACDAPREVALVDVASASEQGAATSASVPPGYRPPALIPADYNPPPLLTLSPADQLDVYGRMEDFFIGQTAKRGERESALPRAARTLAPTISWKGKTYGDVATFMADARLTGVLALKDGEVVMEQYALGRSAQDRWTSFSVGKSLTSLLVGAAIQDGFIENLDEPVTKYIPDLAGSAYEGVSIRQLLTMTSGVQWNEDYLDPSSDVARSATWLGEPGVNPMVSYMRRLPRAAAPGTVFSYKTGETDMAGVLVANATGRGLAAYLSEKIWAPFGMDRDAFWVVDAGSMERGGCCVSMTLRDYGRLALFVLGGGVAGGKQVVPRWYLKEATRNQVTPPALGSYGYFWWIDAPGMYSARGIFGQSILVVPEEQLVLVTNAAFLAPVGGEGGDAVAALFAAVRAASR